MEIVEMDLHEVFEKFNDDFLKFDQVENKRCSRPDVCGFIILDELIPVNENIIGAAEHDIIYLSIDCEKLAEIATEENIHDLVRCGIMYDFDCDSLSMFA